MLFHLTQHQNANCLMISSVLWLYTVSQSFWHVPPDYILHFVAADGKPLSNHFPWLASDRDSWQAKEKEAILSAPRLWSVRRHQDGALIQGWKRQKVQCGCARFLCRRPGLHVARFCRHGQFFKSSFKFKMRGCSFSFHGESWPVWRDSLCQSAGLLGGHGPEKARWYKVNMNASWFDTFEGWLDEDPTGYRITIFRNGTDSLTAQKMLIFRNGTDSLTAQKMLWSLMVAASMLPRACLRRLRHLIIDRIYAIHKSTLRDPDTPCEEIWGSLLKVTLANNESFCLGANPSDHWLTLSLLSAPPCHVAKFDVHNRFHEGNDSNDSILSGPKVLHQRHLCPTTILVHGLHGQATARASGYSRSLFFWDASDLQRRLLQGTESPFESLVLRELQADTDNPWSWKMQRPHMISADRTHTGGITGSYLNGLAGHDAFFRCWNPKKVGPKTAVITR